MPLNPDALRSTTTLGRRMVTTVVMLTEKLINQLTSSEETAEQLCENVSRRLRSSERAEERVLRCLTASFVRSKPGVGQRAAFAHLAAAFEFAPPRSSVEWCPMR
jgi:hypothetical protein